MALRKPTQIVVLGSSSEMKIRPQRFGESLADAVSHGCGGASILAASPSLLIASYARGGVPGIVGASIFVGAALVLYLVSTLYHAMPPGPTKRVFRRFDHCAIFLLIAGTYTPFTLGILRGPWGWSLFGVVWGLAAIGIAIQGFLRRPPERLSLTLYLAMGWLVLVAIVPIVQCIPMPGILLLLFGGIAYTVGAVFYAFDRLPYFHFVWHLFVLGGTTFHFLAVRNYAV